VSLMKAKLPDHTVSHIKKYNILDRTTQIMLAFSITWIFFVLRVTYRG
jgi:hypothetical protein